MSRPVDPYSYSKPEEVCVRHVDLNLKADFDRRVLEGTAVLRIERASDYPQAPLILDTRDLTIQSIEAARPTCATSLPPARS